MDQKEERLHELMVWLEEVKGVKLNAQDVEYFRNVISLARNDAWNEATEVSRKLFQEMGRK